jgi:alkanesulfonate monooxygenase SsuD/methylene tetrahydromethanopterin reductase-like flavin-dependent oxidoreductase (luciferase family)
VLGHTLRSRRSLWAGTIIGEDPKDFAKAVEALKPAHPAYFQSRIAGTPEECSAKIQAYAELGVTDFILYFTWNELKSLETFARRVIPAFH